MRPTSMRKKVSRLGLVTSLVAAFLMVALPASEGWAQAPPPGGPAAGWGELTVTVKDPDGYPKANASVTATFLGETGKPLKHLRPMTGLTGPTGQVRFNNISAGTWDIAAFTMLRELTGAGTATVTSGTSVSVTVKLAAKSQVKK